MKHSPTLVVCAVATFGFLTGCNSTSKAPDVAEGIRTSLRQAGYSDVSVSQDRDKGVVTLTGKVAGESDKVQAGSLARSMASGQVVSNEIAVLPPGGESIAKTVNADLDQGIQKNLEAALVQIGMDKDVKGAVKNGVVTLNGEVDSQIRRDRVERIATAVPYVQQVVNEVQVKNQKATSSN